MKQAFFVSHVRALLHGEEDVKIMGIYGSDAPARLAVRRSKRRAGFRDAPAGFSFDRYEVGQDQWSDGFATVRSRTKKEPIQPPVPTRGNGT